MSTPLIGLSTYREQAAWGVWAQRADVLQVEYADAVVSAGGAPVLLPPATSRPDVAPAVVRRLDGLVLTGGADVEPARYGESPHPRTAGWREDRDAWELALLQAADTEGIPVLGVCRGMQLMAVAAGGKLQQHTPDVLGSDLHSPGRDAFGEVTVTSAEGSRLRSAEGERLQVRCHHHQSVREHPGYTATAWADDGSLEAFEAAGDRFCVAVQWHPEMGRDQLLFDALVSAARADISR
ncbi:MAG: gamma-glutamyl-gamma-aminobutyrate hydrolase family protein [Actinomycetota bacterium]|nr:gamma-glutamyl-gamma-aminobutyrate hydrolase family protein [Actinomycetota bacterium]